MAFDAKVLQFFVASPSDVPRERAIVREVLAEWNDLHSQELRIVLLPIMWETHVAPELGGRAQGMINDKLLVNADALIGIFWGKLGSPTGVAASGTLEEIQQHHARNRPVHLYFSKKKGAPRDFAQHQEVEKAEAWAQTQGITEGVTSPEDFRKKLTRQLPLMLRTQYTREQIGARSSEPVPSPAASRNSGELSPAAGYYLHQIVKNPKQEMTLRETKEIVQIISDRRRLFNSTPSAESEQQKAALGELVSRKFADIRRGGRDDTIFTPTKAGIGWVMQHPETLEFPANAEEPVSSSASLTALATGLSPQGNAPAPIDIVELLGGPSEGAAHLLKAAANDGGSLTLRQFPAHTLIRTKRRELFNSQNPILIAAQKKMLEELVNMSLVQPMRPNDTDNVYTVTDRGMVWVNNHAGPAAQGLPSRADRYLRAVAEDAHGQIILSTPLSGKVDVGSARRTLDSSIEPREIAEMREALDYLRDHGFIRPANETPGAVVYEITAEGFRRIDQ